MAAEAAINVNVESALSEAKERYIARNPKSFAHYTEACAAMPGGNTRTVLYYAPFPLALVRGEAQHLFDADGHRYVDFLGEYTAGLYGHSHPVIRAAIDKALNEGIDLGGHNVVESKLAAAVVKRFPSIDLVRFTNSGTEANLMAISLCAAVKGKRGVLVMNGGYHGGVFYFTGGGSPINAPFNFVVATYNDVAGTRALIEKHAADLAVVIVEPMMGGGGCIAASREFLAMLREETRKRGIFLIFDEVMTSRLAPGGLQEKHDILPDMTTLGKYIGGGMTFGAFGGRRDLMERFDPRRADALPHAGTFNNNILTMSAGLAGLTKLYPPEMAVELNARGDRLRERLTKLIQSRKANMQVTGLGSMNTVHFLRGPIQSPADAAKGDQGLRELFFFDMLAHGIWIARRGMINLSLPITEADCDKLVGAIEEFLTTRASLLS
jgi:glutamate-1-semialdehyde 2,1-aminomutase